MKRTVFLGIFSLLTSYLHAQTITDTVSIGTGYPNQVWYSLQNDEQQTAATTNWDLAFDASGKGASILINSVEGTMLWIYRKADSSGWATVDTTGLSAWPPLYNSDTSWSYGAFRQTGSLNPLDMGWGSYNLITHTVSGDSLYIIRLANSTYKKLWIQLLAGGVYTFRYANLDGTADTTVDLAKATYRAKNFGYYSIRDSKAVDLEPLSADWDLLFTQYTAITSDPYTVQGVLANMGIKVAEARTVDTGTDSYHSYTYSTAINEIGYDWKHYSNEWVVEDSLVYFIEDHSGTIWKLIFTGFGGVSDGNYVFSKEKIASTGIAGSSSQPATAIAVYPNPSTGNSINILYSLKKPATSAKLYIYDLRGNEISQYLLNTEEGFHQLPLNVEGFAKGIYLAATEADGERTMQKMIIQ